MRVNARKISVALALIFLVVISLPLASTVSAQRYSWCTLNVTVNMSGAGTVTPGTGQYIYGDTIYVTEYTNPGYAFDGWYLNGAYQGKLSSIQITMTQDYNLLAVFSKRVVFLTVTSNPYGAGTIAPGAGIWNYTAQDNIIVKEFPSPGYTFDGWYLDGRYLGAGTSITVTMDSDHQLSAYFSGGNGTEPTPEPTAVPEPTQSPAPNLPMPALTFYCMSSSKYSGFNVKIEGMLTYDGVGLSGAGMRLAYSVTGGATWQDLAYVNTGDDGSFSCFWMPSASGNYAIRATWMGDDAYSGVSKAVNFVLSPPEDEAQNVFTLASNSTLTSLVFDSTKNELSFGVSGPSGTAGYTQVCMPKSLVSDPTALRVSIDGTTVEYSSFSEDDVLLITVIYSHSSHQVVMDLDAKPSSNEGSIGDVLSSIPVLVAIIVVLVVVIAALLIINLGRRKAKTT
jgi:uncharacterized repeat protein (TIGR02543 family)